MGKKIKGFKLGRRLIRVSGWVFWRFRTRPGYQKLGSSASRKPMEKVLKWGRKLARQARSVCVGSGYVPIGSEPVKEELSPAVPKGHLAVYVGREDGEFHRELVPVIYFNHPLFGELLKEAEKEFGFQHPGGITIPCRFTEFERVKTRIESGYVVVNL
ncbi:Auxin-responsive protein SAUR36 [Senna tora]|uniref:Auxin-responsive protein SAUR36 n=1 Tax=Senna tora TaxID=362788 RepID=A0A834TPJ1_9FABA|nr:Auxin-responsive protein SAUR36 [Senna tora]